jgi:hypothetical protein
MVKNDNPAGRLHSILSSATKIDGRSGGTPATAGWSEVFAIEPPNELKAAQRFVEAAGLVEEIEWLVRSFPDLNQESYLGASEQLRKLFSPYNFSGIWDRARAHITEALLVRLEFLSDALSERVGEQEVEQEELDSLLKALKEVVERMLSSEAIEPKFKALAIEQLEALRQSILGYRIHGIRGLARAYGATVVVLRIGLLVSSATGVQELVEMAKPLLKPGSGE